MIDVLVVGAGPAGAIAAWRLAVAGARVLVVDRATLPREKLCGDTLNPGAVALLDSLPLGESPTARGRRLTGMLVTGPHARVEARYGDGLAGLAIRRRVFDEWLLNRAMAAGARFEGGMTARRAIVDGPSGRPIVRGVTLARRGAAGDIRALAAVTIAADGRASAVARSVGLARHPRAPRRWAFGTYATGVSAVGEVGEMHIRGRCYLGIAPITDEWCNVCAVLGDVAPGRTPLQVLRSVIDQDARLRDRFRSAHLEPDVAVLGPLAVEADAAGLDGLLLAGDAAGFIDPMTGDGLHLALRGGLLAADAALVAVATGDGPAAVRSLQDMRRRQLGGKLRFNRVLRRVVDSETAVEVAAWGAHLVPAAARWAIRRAGDAA